MPLSVRRGKLACCPIAPNPALWFFSPGCHSLAASRCVCSAPLLEVTVRGRGKLLGLGSSAGTRNRETWPSIS
jgi:hypothetical protein